MLETGDVAIAAAATSAAFPDRAIIDAVHLGIPGYVSRSIKFTDAERFRARLGWDQDGVLPEALPTRWTKINRQIALNSKADRAYTAKMAFYKTPAALGDDNLTNWLTDKYPTLLRRVCLMFAAEARKEFDSMDRAEIKAIETIDQIKVESDLGMRGMELDFNWEGSELTWPILPTSCS